MTYRSSCQHEFSAASRMGYRSRGGGGGKFQPGLESQADLVWLFSRLWISIDPDGLDHFPRWQAVEAHIGDLRPQHTEQGVSQTVRNLSWFSMLRPEIAYVRFHGLPSREVIRSEEHTSELQSRPHIAC